MCDTCKHDLGGACRYWPRHECAEYDYCGYAEDEPVERTLEDMMEEQNDV